MSKGHLLMPNECQERIAESSRILIEKSEEFVEKQKLVENDYWTDLINERNITKNNGNNILKNQKIICSFFHFFFVFYVFFIKIFILNKLFIYSKEFLILILILF